MQDGTVERGYGGRSVFHWEELPQRISRPRYKQYAARLASIGINAVSLSNVNACDHGNEALLSPEYIRKAAVLAGVFAHFGIATFLTPCFASPIVVGHLSSADPTRRDVSAWWNATITSVASAFAAQSAGERSLGGFLFKADSEGQPGPQLYNLTEPEGSAPLAALLRPHDALLLWRAFAHPGNLGPARIGDQPLLQFEYFKRLDGLWAENVVLQIKNGPMDFQVHEPVHSLFGALRHTNVILELEAAQEYTGQAWHLCHLPSMWASYLAFDTHCAPGGGPWTLSQAIAALPRGYGLAAVSNFGEGDAWTGHPMSAASSFGFGRLGWRLDASAEDVTREWVELTWGLDARVTAPILRMLLSSWAAYESYTAPLGLSAVDGHCNVSWGFPCRTLPDGMPADKSSHYWHAPALRRLSNNTSPPPLA